MDPQSTLAALSRLVEELRERGFEKLPSERELSLRLNTSRSAVRRALDELERGGVISRVRGRAGGAYLQQLDEEGTDGFARRGDEQEEGRLRRVERPLDTVVGVPQMLRAQGFASGTRVLTARLEEPQPAEREAFRLPVGDRVVVIVRLRFADGDSLSLESFRVPASLVPGLLHHPLNGSIYELIESRYGIRAAHVQEQIRVVAARPNAASSLGVGIGDALLRVTRSTQDQRGRPFERSVDLFRADRTLLSVRAHAEWTAAPDHVRLATELPAVS